MKFTLSDNFLIIQISKSLKREYFVVLNLILIWFLPKKSYFQWNFYDNLVNKETASFLHAMVTPKMVCPNTYAKNRVEKCYSLKSMKSICLVGLAWWNFYSSSQEVWGNFGNRFVRLDKEEVCFFLNTFPPNFCTGVIFNSMVNHFGRKRIISRWVLKWTKKVSANFILHCGLFGGRGGAK